MPLIFGAEGRRSNAFASRRELPPHSAISGTGRRLAVLAVRAGTGLKLIRARLAPLGRNEPGADLRLGDQSQGARSSETLALAAGPQNRFRSFGQAQ
jgi:hypothetical protein